MLKTIKFMVKLHNNQIKFHTPPPSLEACALYFRMWKRAFTLICYFQKVLLARPSVCPDPLGTF